MRHAVASLPVPRSRVVVGQKGRAIYAEKTGRAATARNKKRFYGAVPWNRAVFTAPLQRPGSGHGPTSLSSSASEMTLERRVRWGGGGEILSSQAKKWVHSLLQAYSGHAPEGNGRHTLVCYVHMSYLASTTPPSPYSLWVLPT